MDQQLKRTLLSLAGLGVFLLLAFGSLDSTNENTSNSDRSSNSGSRSTNTDTTTYVNSKSDFTGELKDNYVDFSFDYPNSWKRDPKAGKGSSHIFVKVEKAASNGDTIESFACGWLTGLRDDLPQLAGRLSDQFSFPEYKKVSEGNIRIGSYDGYEFRFTARLKASEGSKEMDIWGRVVLLPGTGARKGATLTMLTTSAGSDVHGPEDVGEKGELPIILNSFRFGS